jgi:transposase
MRKSRFREEQIIGVMREQEAGARTEEVCRRHGISTTTVYKWKARYGGLDHVMRAAFSGAQPPLTIASDRRLLQAAAGGFNRTALAQSRQ